MIRLLLCLLLLVPSGCIAAVAAGAAGAIYVNGELDAEVDGTPDQVGQAAQRACGALELRDVSATITKIDSAVRASTADDRAVRIDVEPIGDRTSEISIRVGTFGDEKLSVKILDAIKAQL